MWHLCDIIECTFTLVINVTNVTQALRLITSIRCFFNSAKKYVFSEDGFYSTL